MILYHKVSSINVSLWWNNFKPIRIRNCFVVVVWYFSCKGCHVESYLFFLLLHNLFSLYNKINLHHLWRRQIRCCLYLISYVWQCRKQDDNFSFNSRHRPVQFLWMHLKLNRSVHNGTVIICISLIHIFAYFGIKNELWPQYAFIPYNIWHCKYALIFHSYLHVFTTIRQI